MSVTTSVDGLAAAVEKELKAYSDEVNQKIRKQTDKSMRQLVQETKATAPVGNRAKHYRDSITSKVSNASSYAYERQWYVRGSDYRLSHLLNNGHALRDGGRYSGTQFIKKAEVSVVRDYEDTIKEILEDG